MSFDRFARRLADITGRPATFFGALAVVVLWAVCGPFFGYSETWQLIINTGTTIITFLMVFLIQNAQNRDTRAIQLKLDELIRAMESAKNELIDLEDASEAEVSDMQEKFSAMAHRARPDPKAPPGQGKNGTADRKPQQP